MESIVFAATSMKKKLEERGIDPCTTTSPYLSHAKQALYHLSYTPKFMLQNFFVATNVNSVRTPPPPRIIDKHTIEEKYCRTQGKPASRLCT